MLVRAPWRLTAMLSRLLGNIDIGFGLAVSLARAKNVAEMMELQAAYWRKQLSELAAPADVAAPLRTQV